MVPATVGGTLENTIESHASGHGELGDAWLPQSSRITTKRSIERLEGDEEAGQA